MRNLAVVFILIILFVSFTMPAIAAGPWKGKIIDIETKEPIDGAVVVAFWERVWRTPAGGNPYVYEVKEVLTDKEGRFEMPSYTPINLLPIISYMKGPEFIIFKPGYGSLQMALGKYLTGEIGIEPYLGKLSGHIIKVSPGVIELQKLKTREERLRNIPSLPSWDEHLEDQKNLIRLINEEEENLGLQKSDPFKTRELLLKGREK